MNNDRRKSITKLATEVGKLQANFEKMMELLNELPGEITGIKEEIEGIRDEEQEYYENMPESLQGGDKGSAAEAAVSVLEDAAEKLGELSDQLEGIDLPDEALQDVIGMLEDAAQ